MFSNNQWTYTTPANRGFGNPRPPQPLSQFQQQNPLSQQAPQGFQPPQVQWPQQTPDMGYANQLAQMFASQMPNQQVPGSAPLPTFQPPQQGLPTPQPQVPVHGDWRDAFKAAKREWKALRPDGPGQALMDWRMQKPDRGAFFGFGGQ